MQQQVRDVKEEIREKKGMRSLSHTGKVSTIYKLKLHNTVESIKHLPFDVVYIAKGEKELEIVKSSFKSVFHFKPNQEMCDHVNNLRIGVLERHSIDRTGDHHKVFRGDDKPRVSGAAGEIVTDHYFCIPSLTHRYRGQTINKYMVNRRVNRIIEHNTAIMSNLKGITSPLENMELSRDGESFLPCSICNNAVEKADNWNACRIGSTACLKNIYLSKDATFISKYTNEQETDGGKIPQGDDKIDGTSDNREPVNKGKHGYTAFKDNSLCVYQVSHDIHKDHLTIIDDMSLSFNMLNIKNKNMHEQIRKRKDFEAYHCYGYPQYWDNGGLKKIRYIQEPNPVLKRYHKVFNNYLSSIPTPKHVSAYVKGKSIKNSVSEHLRPVHWLSKEEVLDRGDFVKGLEEDDRYTRVEAYKKSGDQTSELGYKYYQPIVMIRLDIKNYFNSIKESHVRNFFKYSVGYSHYVSGLLASLCTVKMDRPECSSSSGSSSNIVKILAQGSPVSGSLSNHVGYWMFGRAIHSLTELMSDDWEFSIYSDDIVLTHPDNTISEEEVQNMVENAMTIVERSGLKINKKKTKVLRSKHGPLKLLGLSIGDKVDIPKDVRENMLVLLKKIIKEGWSSKVLRDMGKVTPSAGDAYVRGMILYIKQVNKEYGEMLGDLYKNISEIHPIKNTVQVIKDEYGF